MEGDVCCVAEIQGRAGRLGGERQDMMQGQKIFSTGREHTSAGSCCRIVRGSGVRCVLFAVLEVPEDCIQKMLRSR